MTVLTKIKIVTSTILAVVMVATVGYFLGIVGSLILLALMAGFEAYFNKQCNIIIKDLQSSLDQFVKRCENRMQTCEQRVAHSQYPYEILGKVSTELKKQLFIYQEEKRLADMTEFMGPYLYNKCVEVELKKTAKWRKLQAKPFPLEEKTHYLNRLEQVTKPFVQNRLNKIVELFEKEPLNNQKQLVANLKQHNQKKQAKAKQEWLGWPVELIEALSTALEKNLMLQKSNHYSAISVVKRILRIDSNASKSSKDLPNRLPARFSS